MLAYTQLQNPSDARPKGALNRKIFTVVTLAFLSLIIYFLVSDYFATINHVGDLSLDRLQGIARDLSQRIDGDLHQDLSSRLGTKDAIRKSDDDEAYQLIHRQLAQAHQAHQLSSPIYTFVKSGGKGQDLEFIATSSDIPYYRHQYTSMPAEGFEQLNFGGVLELYEDEFGSWLSAFAPIKNRQGDIIAYVQTDEKFDHFIHQVRMQSMRNALFSLLGFSVVFFLLLRYLRQTLTAEEQQKTLLKQTLAESQRLSEKLEASEQQLKENAAQLQQSNKDLTDFAHIASHDLKAPVRSIHSFAQLLKRRLGNQLDENAEEYLGFILSNADRAQKLISGLLQYSTADKNMGEQTIFPLCNAVKEAKQSLITVLTERNASIIFSDLPVVKANLTLISQVMQNLINNGIKYNEADHPVVEVSSGIDPERGRYFVVKDNGIGIAAEYQKDIFNMFTRLHSSEQYEGSGIGLAFCVRVIKAYGGEMWLTSKEGEGASFFFSLPNAIQGAKTTMTPTKVSSST